MSNIASIEGVTGPGRHVKLNIANADEVSFKFSKNVIEVTANGVLSTYDLMEAGDITTTHEGSGYLITVKKKDDPSTKKDEHVGEVRHTTEAGPVAVGGHEAQSTKKADFPPKK